MEYMRWAKVHERVRYELTDSGVPAVHRRELDTLATPPTLENPGPYGHPQLIEAIARRYRVPAGGVVLAPGASGANFLAISAAVACGGCVMLEQPTYEPLRRLAAFLHLRVIPLRRDPARNFGMVVEDVELGLDDGAAAVVLTNLHNPSGQELNLDTIRAVAERCARAGATLIVDEVYLDAARLSTDQACWTAANVAENVIATNSLTKVYGLSGLRAGWLLTNAELAERARRVMDLTTVNNSAPSMSLALAAMGHIAPLEERYRTMYAAGQAVYRRWLAEEPRVQGYPSCGAIFELVRLPEGVSSGAFNELLAARYDTQVTPGHFFELDDHVRVSLTLPGEALAEALRRLSAALDAVE